MSLYKSLISSPSWQYFAVGEMDPDAFRACALNAQVVERSLWGSNPPRTIFAEAKKEDSFFNESLVAEMGFEPHDLRVMSPTSCQTAPLRDIIGAGSRGRTGTRKNLTGF